MKRVSSLVEKFLLEKSSTFSTFSKLPIVPKNANEEPFPVKPVNKWITLDKHKLYNNYVFQNNDLRDEFLFNLLGYEKNFGHRAKIIVEDLSIEIEVYTKDLNLITELDREYAKRCDLIYKNLTYVAR